MASFLPDRNVALPLLRLAFGLVALVAMGRQLTIQIEMGFSVVNFFSYFTNLSNLFAAIVLLVGASHLHPARTASGLHDALRGLSVVNMAIVGIVYVALLRDVDLGSLLPWVNVVLHYVMPCVVVLDWLLDPPKARLGAKQLLQAHAVPAAYLAYVLLRGNHTGWYPYPFLDPDKVGGYGGVAAYALAIAATFFIVGWLLIAAANRGRGASRAA